MIKASQIDTTTVTPEQIGACYKFFVGSTAYYAVQSESDPFKQHTVSWSKEHGFTCGCPSGLRGFANCKDGICKHVRWSVAAAREERQAVAELQAAIAEQAKPVATTSPVIDAETMKRVHAAKPAKVGAAKGRTNGFSLLKV